MSYSSLDQTRLVAGKPLTTDEMVLIANDLDDLNTRVTTALASTQNFEPYTFEVLGDYYASGFGLTALTYKRVHTNITLIGASIFLITDGITPGQNLEIDILYSRSGGAFASIFTTKPIVAQGGGQLTNTANGVLGVTNLLVGDVLRLDVTQAMDGNEGFQALLTWQKT